jgi:RNA polymerase sigma-70 factor (ECF subfamily)
MTATASCGLSNDVCSVQLLKWSWPGGIVPAKKMIETIEPAALSSGWYSSVVSVNAITESGLDVAACVERVRQRDEDAARLLLGHLYPLVLKLVRAHLPRRTSEEDMAQIVFMKVFANLDRYSGAVPLEHWVSRITVNACINQLESERVRPELRWADLSEEQCNVLEALAGSTDELHPDQSLAAREIVEKLLAVLEPRDRMLLTLLHLEGRSPREVQRITGWNGVLVRGRAFRARQKLKKHFKNLMKEGGQ